MEALAALNNGSGTPEANGARTSSTTPELVGR